MASAIGNGPLEAVGVEVPEIQLKRKNGLDMFPTTEVEEAPVIIHAGDNNDDISLDGGIEAPVAKAARMDKPPVIIHARDDNDQIFMDAGVEAPVTKTARMDKANDSSTNSLVLRRGNSASYQQSKTTEIKNAVTEAIPMSNIPTGSSTATAAGDELTQAAAFVMSNMAKSVMEGGAQMFNQFLNNKLKMLEDRRTTCQSTTTTLQVMTLQN